MDLSFQRKSGMCSVNVINISLLFPAFYHTPLSLSLEAFYPSWSSSHPLLLQASNLCPNQNTFIWIWNIKRKCLQHWQINITIFLYTYSLTWYSSEKKHDLSLVPLTTDSKSCTGLLLETFMVHYYNYNLSNFVDISIKVLNVLKRDFVMNEFSPNLWKSYTGCIIFFKFCFTLSNFVFLWYIFCNIFPL